MLSDGVMEGIFNREIARELLMEVNPDTDDELIDKMLAISPNPWDSAILYQLLELKKQQETIDLVGKLCNPAQ